MMPRLRQVLTPRRRSGRGMFIRWNDAYRKRRIQHQLRWCRGTEDALSHVKTMSRKRHVQTSRRRHGRIVLIYAKTCWLNLRNQPVKIRWSKFDAIQLQRQVHTSRCSTVAIRLSICISRAAIGTVDAMLTMKLVCAPWALYTQRISETSESMLVHMPLLVQVKTGICTQICKLSAASSCARFAVDIVRYRTVDKACMHGLIKFSRLPGSTVDVSIYICLRLPSASQL